MAVLVPVVASSALFADSVVRKVQCGEAIDFGKVVYKKSADNKYWRTNADAEESAQAAGIACSTCDTADGYVIIVTRGGIDLGVVGTVAEDRYVFPAATPGGLGVVGDLTAATSYKTRLGAFESATKFYVDIHITGVKVP